MTECVVIVLSPYLHTESETMAPPSRRTLLFEHIFLVMPVPISFSALSDFWSMQICAFGAAPACAADVVSISHKPDLRLGKSNACAGRQSRAPMSITTDRLMPAPLNPSVFIAQTR